MKIAIFGASGATGVLLVEQALDRGHQVTAFVRDAGRLAQKHLQLRCVVGDVMEPSTLDAAVAEQDAVLCALGTMPESSRDRPRRQRGLPVCSVGTRNIIAAMTQHQVHRLIVESSACVGTSRRTGRFAAGHLVYFMLHDVMRDKELQERWVRESALDWTLIRPVRLSNAAPSQRIQCGQDLRWGLTSTISRADVAAFMLDSISCTAFSRCAVTVRD